MWKKFLIMSLVLVMVLSFTTCAAPTPTPTPAPAPIPETERENPAIITDRTGRDWDVTRARDVYGMNPDYFNYVLGIGAIPSVDNPIILKEGDSGYPSSDSHIQVFGVNHNGEQRAYSISALTQHDVFNDVYPGESNQYLAVAY